MMLLGFAGLGYAAYRRTKRGSSRSSLDGYRRWFTQPEPTAAPLARDLRPGRDDSSALGR
jgi:hypothetical protein